MHATVGGGGGWVVEWPLLIIIEVVSAGLLWWWMGWVGVSSPLCLSTAREAVALHRLLWGGTAAARLHALAAG